MLNQEMKDIIDDIVLKHGNKQSSIISILQDIQERFNYLPEDVLEYIANKMDISPAKIYGVATFYENFSLKPKGKYVIKICDGTACHVKKSIPILNALQKELGLDNEKNTTEDLLFTVETVSCLGACGLAPVLNINDRVYGKMTPENAVELINKLREEA
ncbi:NADH-quinone oxidoreductase subunit NuoE family protein [Tepidimicrobium xylanilyticum]|uniref:NADH-quinone oxidoreductase subunit E n=1 Tax=Tepidimicrobium xylanilyticum TaxID=1123352 RepID=A0A1H3B6U3_9FIRM|nr:NAD(P)H-dependent oxidoreductase subunit E [Tepidimicrobium xylanilyticum]GMG96981.1 NADH dehydrogenase [Tepidimicrobium xylanilyticum]SDX37676.1 NADH-quinone oxidoreductase subunit E [Tepidimicrobium xylanilyticum]